MGDSVNLGAINADRLKVYLEPLPATPLDSTNDSDSPPDSESRAEAQPDIADDAGTQTDNVVQPPLPNNNSKFNSQVEIAMRIPLPDSAREDDEQSDIAIPQPTNLET
ncbi:unnamed protein product, partial [Rotaria sp. Silwood1]